MYIDMNEHSIKRDTDGAIIPKVGGNRDYQEYLEWIAAGNIISPAPPPLVIIPTVVTMRQARLALLQSGLLSQIDVAIAALHSPQKEAAQIEWEYSQELKIDNTLVVSLSTSLGLTEQQISDLFLLASTL